MLPHDMTDIVASQHGITDLEITIRADGRVVWINTNHGTCLFRICGLTGEVRVIDERKPMEQAERQAPVNITSA